jgi:putative DNA primase/helicase
MRDDEANEDDLSVLGKEVELEGDPPPEFNERPNDNRPVIRLKEGELLRVVRESQAALAEIDVFNREQRLVMVDRLKKSRIQNDIRYATNTLLIKPLKTEHIQAYLPECRQLQRWNGTRNKWLPSDVPDKVARAILELSKEWTDVPRLRGVVSCPTLRDDGALLTQSGYDPQSELFLDIDGVAFPKIKEEPTRRDAEAALKRLRTYFAEFPFIAPEMETTAISALLTAVVRPTLPAAPLFLFDAPAPASGKSLLSWIVSYIATGADAVMMSQPYSQEEFSKSLLATLINGPSVVVIDNVEHDLKSASFCSILTGSAWKARLLGESTEKPVPTNVTWIANGNNINTAGDLTSRSVLARIDANVEKPGERKFKINLRQAIPNDRPKIVADILTIVRAYIVAGYPKASETSLERFEVWERWCRNPLLWLGMEDTYKSKEYIEEGDTERSQQTLLISAWYATFNDQRKTVADVCSGTHEGLMQEALAMFQDRGAPNTKRMGKFILKMKGRLIDGLRFVKDGNRGGVIVWKVEKVK